ncbi:MAG: hypothetical protein ACLQMF_04055 [Rectinemataceae bacterium]
MRLRGISYDVGRVMGGNWRPDFDPLVVRRELAIIRDELHCNAVRICGRDIRRLSVASGIALELGLEVWLSPELWDRSPRATLAYLEKAAAAAEKIRMERRGELVFLVGSESTLFMRGIVPGRSVAERMRRSWTLLKEGRHNAPLNAFLAEANAVARGAFHGRVSYASLVWEAVDWKLFDAVGVDHYWNERIADRYLELLAPVFAFGKPVVITEFGFRTYRGAALSTEGLAGDLADYRPSLRVIAAYLANAIRGSLFGAQPPPPRMKLKSGSPERDEHAQALALLDQLRLLDAAGVEGAFISTFVSPTAPYDEDPSRDLDKNSYSLVKTLAGRTGTTYPGLPWEPKAAFRAVADFYLLQRESRA